MRSPIPFPHTSPNSNTNTNTNFARGKASVGKRLRKRVAGREISSRPAFNSNWEASVRMENAAALPVANDTGPAMSDHESALKERTNEKPNERENKGYAGGTARETTSREVPRPARRQRWIGFRSRQEAQRSRRGKASRTEARADSAAFHQLNIGPEMATGNWYNSDAGRRYGRRSVGPSSPGQKPGRAGRRRAKAPGPSVLKFPSTTYRCAR